MPLLIYGAEEFERLVELVVRKWGSRRFVLIPAKVVAERGAPGVYLMRTTSTPPHVHAVGLTSTADEAEKLASSLSERHGVELWPMTEALSLRAESPIQAPRGEAERGGGALRWYEALIFVRLEASSYDEARRLAEDAARRLAEETGAEARVGSLVEAEG